MLSRASAAGDRGNPQGRGEGRGGQEQRGRAAVDFRHRGAEAKGQRPMRRLRPLRDALLPRRIGLPRGLALSLGGERLLAARRDRMRHRQAAARARRRQPALGRHADLPQPLAGPEGARAQPAAEGRKQGRRPRSAQARAGAADCALFPLLALQADLRAVGSGHRRAAGLHRRLQQHGGVEARLRVDFRLPAQERGR